MNVFWRMGCGIALIGLTLAAGPSEARPMTLAEINEAGFEEPKEGERSPAMMKVQVLLDRARFVPGVIDGYDGMNTRNAIAAFARESGLEANGGRLTREIWDKLTQDVGEEVAREYTISEEDVGGPFVEEIPEEMEKKAELDRLAYTGPEQLLAEKFHMHREFLRALNPGADFGKAGEVILVANPARPELKAEVTRIEVLKSEAAVRAYDGEGKLVAYYPASIGSDETPSPSGTRKVESVALEPKFYYDPEALSFKGGPDKRLVLPPGPNNPVGLVWIDLDEPTYGIHGTPDPEQLGRDFSHGCVRMSNWDARDLAGVVKVGATVEFVED